MILPFNFTQTPRELLSQTISLLDAGQRCALITLVNIEGNAPYPIGTQMLVAEGGQFWGQITGGCAEKAIADQAVKAISKGRNEVQRYGLNSPFFDIRLPCGSGIDVHFNCELNIAELRRQQGTLAQRKTVTEIIQADAFEFEKHYLPNLRILVFGQGPILVKLAELGLASGLDVACVAQNQDTANLLDTAGLVYSQLDIAAKQFEADLDSYTGFVSLFHEHDLETQLLCKALETNAFYIGALGSKRTHETRLQGLRDIGVASDSLVRVMGPVGLNIGANTPAQIAISILAEIIAHANGHA